jgi:hypothetical protein
MFSSGLPNGSCSNRTLNAFLITPSHVTFTTHRVLLYLISRIIFGQGNQT